MSRRIAPGLLFRCVWLHCLTINDHELFPLARIGQVKHAGTHKLPGNFIALPCKELLRRLRIGTRPIAAGEILRIDRSVSQKINWTEFQGFLLDPTVIISVVVARVVVFKLYPIKTSDGFIRSCIHKEVLFRGSHVEYVDGLSASIFEWLADLECDCRISA